MDKFAQTIKQLAQGVFDGNRPCNWTIGTLTVISPLEIKIKDGLVLHSATLTITNKVHDIIYGGTVSMLESGTSEFKNYTIRASASVGDKFILFRQQGGQSYLIVDKLIE